MLRGLYSLPDVQEAQLATRWRVVDRRALETPWVRAGVILVLVIGLVLGAESFRTNNGWLGAAGLFFIVVASALWPPPLKKAGRGSVR